MNKKEFLIPFIFTGLAAAFLFISAMVYFSNGKSKKWVARKMSIGAILLTMSYISCSNNQNNDKYPVNQFISCYVTVYDDNIKIEIETDSNHLIYGYISGNHGGIYSYSIVNKEGDILQKADISTKRWSFDFENEEFVIGLNQKIDKGSYQFRLYNCNVKEQDSIKLVKNYKFKNFG